MNEAESRPDVASEIDGEYSITHKGRLAPSTRECAVEVLRSLFTGDVSMAQLREYDVSNKTVYGFFDGVEDAERAAFGETIDYVCDVCSTEFDNREHFKAHRRGCNEGSISESERVENLLNIHSTESEYSVYRLKIRHTCDNVEYWYIGQSNSIEKRLHSHLKRGETMLSMPHSGEMSSCPKYEVIGFEVLSDAKTQSEARNLEREYALETAIENNSTNVLGGK